MYRKRLLAAILCVAMLASSGAGTTVYAQEGISLESVSEISAEMSSEEEDETGTVIQIEDEEPTDEATEEASAEEETDEATIEISGEDSEETDDAVIDISVIDSSEDASDVASTESTEDAAAEASSSITNDISADTSADYASIIAEFEAAMEQGIQPLYEAVNSSSSCFDVNSKGVLVLKKGYEVPSVAYIPSNAKTIPVGIFNGSTNIEIVRFEEDSELTTIAAGAFEDSNLKSIDIPKGVTSIKNLTFKNSHLKSIVFEDPTSVKKIGKEAFADTYLTGIEATGVTQVGANAFAGCSNLTNASLTALVKIGSGAFKNCTKLSDRMAFAPTIKTIGKNAFYGCGFVSLDLSSIKTNLVVDTQAFENNKNLVKVVLPDSLVKIPARMFYNCSKLSDVTIGTKTGSKTTTIDTNAFANCTSLVTITFFNVEVFANKAFDGCSGLKTIIIWNKKTSGGNFDISEDAFPLKSGVTMKGFDGKVQDYAEKRGYTYESLFDKHPIYTSYDKNECEIKANVNQATQGTKVKVTITPKSGKLLESITINENEPTELTLVENSSKSQVFTFTMPDTYVKIVVKMKDSKKIISGNLDYTIRPVDGYSTYNKDEIEYFDVVGRQAQFVVLSGVPDADWLWNYSSSNSKVVSVSDTGVLTAVGTGEADITATFKGDSSKKVTQKFKVKEKAEIESLELKLGTPARSKKLEEVIDGEKVTVIQYEKTSLLAESRSFDVSVKAHAKGDPDRNLITTTDWVSVDKQVASVKNSKSTNNINTITVNKGVVGETLITVSVPNPNTGKVGASKSFILRVIDITPRLDNSNITVNSLSTVGTEIGLHPVYGYEILDSYLKLCTKSVKNGITTYIESDELAINCNNGSYYLVSSAKTPYSKTFKDGTQLFITGKCINANNEKESFVLPIGSVNVKKDALSPGISIKGKINLFYNTEDTMARGGEVTLIQSLKNEEIKDYKLVSNANYKKEGSESVDTFANNFDIVKVDDQTFTIKRSSKELKKVDNKVVTSGYIYIKYVGYRDYVKKAITVPTTDAAPGYYLSQTSATVNQYAHQQVFELQLLDKDTKQPVSLDTVTKIGYTAETTDDLFEDPEISGDKIIIRVMDEPFKGKAVFNVKMREWNSSLKYSFSLNVTTSMPSVKFASDKAELNLAFKSQAATLTAFSNQPDAELVRFDDESLVYTGDKNKAADADKIDIQFEKDSIVVKLPNEDIKATSYPFKVVPLIRFSNTSEDVPLKPITFNVNVVNKVPSFKLKSSSFAFNGNFPGKETVTTEYTVGNLPTGFTDFDGITVNVDDVVYEAPKDAPALDKIATVEYIKGDVVVKLTSSRKLAYLGKSYNYKVKGLKVETGKDSVTVPDFSITIKINKDAPSVKVKQTGSINPIDKNSKITYTATISNVVCDVSNVKIWEMDSNGAWYGGSKTSKRYSKHFEITQDNENSAISYLTLKPGEKVDNGKKYNIRLVYTLAVDKKKTYSVDFGITPKQVLPSITTDKKETVIYAGQTNKKVKIAIAMVPGKTPETTINAKFEKPDFAPNTPENIKQAFKIIAFDVSTGVMTLELVKPSALVLNKTYTISFVTRYEDQAPNTTGNKFELKVDLKK